MKSGETMRESYITSGKLQPAYVGQPVLNANLVLEGGAMRGQFTAGVLDYFMDQGLVFRNVIGTSAGALTGFNYVAGQIGRTSFMNMKYCDDPRYMSMANVAQYGTALTREFFFEELPNELEPFDYHAFADSPMSLTAVSSNLETGEADYHRLDEGGSPRDISYLQATSAIPMFCKIVEVDGKRLLDGGICDSVPLHYSMEMGTTTKHVVVLTQDATYKKKPNALLPVAQKMYEEYPDFLERMAYRHFEYNLTYRRIRRLEVEGRIFVIRPKKPVEVSTMERDADKLFDLYCEGLSCAAESFDDLRAYLAQ